MAIQNATQKGTTMIKSSIYNCPQTKGLEISNVSEMRIQHRGPAGASPAVRVPSATRLMTRRREGGDYRKPSSTRAPREGGASHRRPGTAGDDRAAHQ